MPIDPNIALGVRPVEQPNMLGQMGQFMQLRQMQQENESTNALRDFYAQGGDTSTAEGQRRLRSMAPKLGAEILQKEAQTANLRSEISSRDLKAGTDSLKMLKENVGVVNTPQDMAVFLQNASATPGGKMLFNVVPLDKAISAIPSDPKAFEAYKRNFGLTSDKLYADANAMLSAQVTREGHGVQMRGQNMTAGTAANALEFQKQKRNVIAGEGQFLNTDAYGNVYPVAQYGEVNGPNAPASPLPPAAAGNFLATQVAPQQPATNVNALNAQPGAPTVANAAVMNVPRPKEPIRQPVGVMKDGKAVFVKPEEAVGMQPASADAEKAARLQTQKVKDLSLTIKNLEDVTKPGGLISQSTGSGIGRAYDVGAGLFGQATEGAIATAKLAPIADMVLKMVPRFEGPQSDKDTQSYKEAAGQLANSSLPTKTRQEAGKEILRLMKEYKGQFVTDDMAKEGFGGAALTGEDKAAMDWANANPKDPRAAQIKQRLGG